MLKGKEVILKLVDVAACAERPIIRLSEAANSMFVNFIGICLDFGLIAVTSGLIGWWWCELASL
jgi:hypothetical protein